MKKIIKLRENETIPENAKFLHSQEESDYSNSTYEWRSSPGISGLFFETQYKRTPVITVFYYEVDEDI